jgi:hypothetical protein
VSTRDHFNVAILLVVVVVLVLQPNPQLSRAALAFGALCCVLKLLVRRR